MYAADKIINDFPEIEQWYIAGHSLGGAMASSYASEHKDKIDGGNHGQFGNYGQQKGDGIATISSEEQQGESVQYIISFINEIY